MLTENQRKRYARHLSLPEIGEAGQEKIRAGRVLIVGVGGLGSPAAYYLTAAGVGTLGLIDADQVDISNLQRQILYTTGDIGTAKIVSASERLRALNPDTKIEAYRLRFTRESAGQLLQDYDFVIDATDNFESKFLIAEVCQQAKKPYSHGGIDGFIGQTMTVIPGKSACYRCVFEPPPPSNQPPRGPLGAVPGVIGSIQAIEALKYLASSGALLLNKILVCNLHSMSFRTVKVTKNNSCPICK